MKRPPLSLSACDSVGIAINITDLVPVHDGMTSSVDNLSPLRMFPLLEQYLVDQDLDKLLLLHLVVLTRVHAQTDLHCSSDLLLSHLALAYVVQVLDHPAHQPVEFCSRFVP